MSISLENYYNEKKKEFFIEMDNGDHGGAFFYKMTFKHEVTRRMFIDAMEEAEKPQNRYASLYDEAFREKHHIESFEGINVDFQVMLEEEYWEWNPETGEYEVAYEDYLTVNDLEEQEDKNVQAEELASGSSGRVRGHHSWIWRLLLKSKICKRILYLDFYGSKDRDRR